MDQIEDFVINSGKIIMFVHWKNETNSRQWYLKFKIHRTKIRLKKNFFRQEIHPQWLQQ